jgi:hypothetical protein
VRKRAYGDAVTPSAEICLERARECEVQAAQSNLPNERVRLLGAASRWRKLSLS